MVAWAYICYTNFNSHLRKSVIAVFLGWFFADEQITTALLVATAIIIISVYLVLYDQYRDGKNKTSEGAID